MRFVYPRASLVVAISDAVAATLIARKICPESLICVIGNPIALKAPSETSPSEESFSDLADREYICAIGRIVGAKGFNVLLQAFAQMRGQRSDLVIFGEGPLRTNLLAQAEQLSIADRVHMPGFVSGPE